MSRALAHLLDAEAGMLEECLETFPGDLLEKLCEGEELDTLGLTAFQARDWGYLLALASQCEMFIGDFIAAARFTPRGEVVDFGCVMEKKLRLHDKDRGDNWKHDSSAELLQGLKHEVRELGEAISAWELEKAGTEDEALFAVEVEEEAADVANFAMFIAWVVGRKGGRR